MTCSCTHRAFGTRSTQGATSELRKKLKGKKELSDVFTFLRGESGQAVLKAKIHHIEDHEIEEADIPDKPSYVPIEDSISIAPAINTATVAPTSLKGMNFAQLFTLRSSNDKFVDWEWTQATIKKAVRRKSDKHLIITVKYDLEKGVRDIDVDDGKKYEVCRVCC